MEKTVKPRPYVSHLNLDFNYEVMEEELTCPVCLELFAEPLILPCSHTICKTCMVDVANTAKKKSPEKVGCPTCRKDTGLSIGKITNLPRNLALENVVIRYSEEKSNSIRKSLSVDSPIVAEHTSGSTSPFDLSEFPTESSQSCGMCDGTSKAAWVCEQCSVYYCHSCFAKYHPMKGALAQHKIRQPCDTDNVFTQDVYCTDHNHEVVSVFCDECKALGCHLCVCEGEGKHAGHRILCPKTAVNKMKDCIQQTREGIDFLKSSFLRQKDKMREYNKILTDVYTESKSKLDVQHERLIQDITETINLEKQLLLEEVDKVYNTSTTNTQQYIDDCTTNITTLESLLRVCDNFTKENVVNEALGKASDFLPLQGQLKDCEAKCKDIQSEYEKLSSEKTEKQNIQSKVNQYSQRVIETVNATLDPCIKTYDSIVPNILSTNSSATSGELSPRIQNKCLITWGFSSTTFSAEPLTDNCSWTVNIEKHMCQPSSSATGFLFAVGIASRTLNVKDIVGSSDASHGIVCVGGNIYFAHDGKQQLIAPLKGLPIAVTLYVRKDYREGVILTYKVMSLDDDGLSVLGKKVINDKVLQGNVQPVFTASQRVKLLLPTCV